MIAMACALGVASSVIAPPDESESLEEELIDRSAVTRLPEPAHELWHAMNCNRASTPRDAPGSLADGDGAAYDGSQCARERSFDGVAFRTRLRVDLESSFGTDIRQPWNHLGYLAMVFYYARPGAKHNRPASLEEARRPIMRLVDDEKNGNRVER